VTGGAPWSTVVYSPVSDSRIPPHLASPRERFAELVRTEGSEIHLAEAALLIAAVEYPELEIRRYLDRLGEMSRELITRLDGAPPSLDAAAAVANAYLFEELGFRGNRDDYHDPRNSYLNDVLDRRTGIPITLSTVFIEVARGAGLDAQGVGLPGHFIVRLQGREGALLLDPFYGGAELTEEDCQARLDRLYGGRVRLRDGMLAPVDRRHILARMLRNLKVLHMKALDHRRALEMVELLLALNPYSGEDRRDRGLIYAAMDCYGIAADDLEAYLSLVPGAPEAEALLSKAAALRELSARLN